MICAKRLVALRPTRTRKQRCEVLKHPRAPTAVLPIRTCSSERLRLLQLKSERYAELEAREAEAEKEPIESIRPSVRHY